MKSMQPYIWTTKDSHFTNEETMMCFIKEHIDIVFGKDAKITHEYGTYIEIKHGKILYGAHAGGDSINHIVRFEIVKTEEDNIPSEEQCISFFLEKGHKKEDAVSFFLYHECRGWVIGKIKSPIKKWKSAASIWMLNKKKYESIKFRNKKNDTVSSSFTDR